MDVLGVLLRDHGVHLLYERKDRITDYVRVADQFFETDVLSVTYHIARLFELLT